MHDMLPHEVDVCALLDRFAHLVAAGTPPSYAAFRQAWSAMRFSQISEARAWPLRTHHGVALLCNIGCSAGFLTRHAPCITPSGAVLSAVLRAGQEVWHRAWDCLPAPQNVYGQGGAHGSKPATAC